MSVAKLERRTDWPQDLVDHWSVWLTDCLWRNNRSAGVLLCHITSNEGRKRRSNNNNNNNNASKQLTHYVETLTNRRSCGPVCAVTFVDLHIHIQIHSPLRITRFICCAHLSFIIFTLLRFYDFSFTAYALHEDHSLHAPPLYYGRHYRRRYAVVCRLSVLSRSWQVAIANPLCCCWAHFGDSPHEQITLLRRSLVIRHIRTQMPIYLFVPMF